MGRPYAVVNIVATASIGAQVDLVKSKMLLSKLGRVSYEPERFPGLRLKTLNGIGVLVFRSGRLVIAGAKSKDELINTVRDVMRALAPILPPGTRRLQLKIQNIVAKADLGVYVDLERMSASSSDVLYDPEQFPGLIYRLGVGKPVVLVFTTGRIVIVGAKGWREVEDTLAYMESVARQYMASGVSLGQPVPAE